MSGSEPSGCKHEEIYSVTLEAKTMELGHSGVLVIVMMWCLFFCTIPYMGAQYRALKLPKNPKHIPGRKKNQ